VTRLVDLDDPVGLELAWSVLERRRALHDVDPELREAIIRRCDRLPSDVAAPILVALDQMHPEAVLEAHFGTLAPRVPTIGAVRRHGWRPRTT